MTAIRDIKNEWRNALVPASFQGEVFHVELGARISGRRTVVHEYPKRNLPYSEDMGRHAIRYNFTAYLVLRDRGPGMRRNLIQQRDALITALEADDAGVLIHPSLGELLVMCERYSYSEQRERGGYMEFDMAFVEAGSPGLSQSFVSAKESMLTAAQNAETSSSLALDSATAFMLQRGVTPGQQ